MLLGALRMPPASRDFPLQFLSLESGLRNASLMLFQVLRTLNVSRRVRRTRKTKQTGVLKSLMENSNVFIANKRSAFSIRYNEKSDAFLIRMGSVSDLVSANLIRHKLGIPYLKKDGTVVTTTEIEESNRKARKAYAEAMISTLTLEAK